MPAAFSADNLFKVFRRFRLIRDRFRFLLSTVLEDLFSAVEQLHLPKVYLRRMQLMHLSDFSNRLGLTNCRYGYLGFKREGK